MVIAMPLLVTVGDTEMRGDACLRLAISLGKVAVLDSSALGTAGRCPELKALGVKSSRGGAIQGGKEVRQAYGNGLQLQGETSSHMRYVTE